ncbi:hypothetical protein HN832_04370 [archaeon]|jgi:hypothetical protein|nr:hypothetical protein [archaeon]MBT4373372.1 hypothetical protein [archaeon]MBT4531820.1 hypothetical protein [archaeon]MBT7001487.1 hypothetical protein [archaeon]MBT7282621.1 hypothetical protein [archaeon]
MSETVIDNTSTQIRKGILDYASGRDKASLFSQAPKGLLTHLVTQLGREVSMDEIQNSFCGQSEGIYDSMMENNPVAIIVSRAEREEKAIGRIEKVLGRPIQQMDAQELEAGAKQMFMLSQEDYKRIAEERGIKLEEDFFKRHYEGNGFDATLLIGVLEKSHGIILGKERLVEMVRETNMGLGYFENITQKGFEYQVTDPFDEEKGVREVWNSFNRKQNEGKFNLEQHTKFDEELKTQHKIAQPTLLKDRTLSLDITPCAIAFDRDNKLVVLGQRYQSESEADRNLTLNAYDIKTGRKVASADTGIMAAFDGFAGMSTSFQGNISVGSNGIIYAGGNNQLKRFNGNLEEITENEGGFQDALNLLADKGISEFSRRGRWASVGIWQVEEDEGVHYFVTRPNDFPKCYDNALVATDGKKLIGVPLGFSPSGGYSNTSFDDTARIVINGNHVYLKSNHDIVAIDKSLTTEAYEKSFKMINGEQLDSGCVPSNHCVDRKGLLWAVTQDPEEVVASVKAYKKGANTGEVMTHFYPQNHPGGWAAMRSMAIGNGTLAYTDTEQNKVRLYQLAE